MANTTGVHNPLVPEDLSADRSRAGQVLERFDRDFTRSDSHFARWRRMAKKYYRTYSGDPWNESDRKFVEEDLGRPIANFNLALGTINAVVGADNADRKEIRFEGVSTEDLYDTTVAEWFTKLARAQFNHFTCNGHRIQSSVFLDGLITGYGFSRTFLNMRRFPFRVGTESLRPWLVYVDPDSWEEGLLDSRFIIYQEDWELEDVRATWPKAKLEGGTIPVDRRGSAQMPRQVNADNYQSGTTRGGMPDPYTDRKVRIFQYQFIQLEDWAAYTDQQSGRDEQLAWREFEEKFGEQKPDHVRFPKEVRFNAYIAAKSVGNDHGTLLELKPLPVDTFTINAYTGLKDVEPDRGRATRFGLMHVIYEPQLWSSKVLSLGIEKLARSGKGTHIFEKGAVDDPDEAKRQLSKPDGILMLEDGALAEGKYRFERAESMPSFIEKMLQIAQEGIPHTSMVTDWLKGTAQQERSNVLVSNLQSQSLMGLSPLIDPLAGFRLQHGLLFTQLAVRYLSAATINKQLGDPKVPGITHEQDPATGRLAEGPDGQPIPITGPDGQPLSAGIILKNADLFEFDVQVDTGQASPTAKQAFWRAMVDTALFQTMIDVLKQEGASPMDLIVEMFKNSPLPVEMTKPLVTKLEQSLKTPSAEQVMAMFQKLPPEQQQQILQMAMQQAGGGMTPQQGQQGQAVQ